MADTSDLPQSVKMALDRFFANRLLANHQEVADLLELSTTTLRRLGNDGRINYRLKVSSWRSYAREDVEAYFRSMSKCRSISPEISTEIQRAHSTSSTSLTRSMGKVVEFTAALAKQARKQRKNVSNRKKRALNPKDPIT